MLLDHHMTAHVWKRFFTGSYIAILATCLHQILTGSRKYMCKQRSAKKDPLRHKWAYLYFLSWNPSLALCPALDRSSSWARNWSATRPQFWAKFRTLHRRREFVQWHCRLLNGAAFEEKDGWQQKLKLEVPSIHVYIYILHIYLHTYFRAKFEGISTKYGQTY